MAKKYKTRVPAVTSRDPKPEKVEAEKSFDSVPIVRVSRAVCPNCGRTAWRVGGTTRPNIPTGEMFKWRKCAHCGLSQYHAYPMSDREKARYSVSDK